MEYLYDHLQCSSLHKMKPMDIENMIHQTEIVEETETSKKLAFGGLPLIIIVSGQPLIIASGQPLIIASGQPLLYIYIYV